MTGKPPRLRPRQSSGAVPSSSTSSSSGNIGPLSVSALAGLVAAAFALFLLGTWLAVILVRRKRRRRRAGMPLKSRDIEKDKEGKGRLDGTAEGTEETAETHFKRLDSSATNEEFKFDPSSMLDRREPSGSTNKSDPQSIVLPNSSFSPASFPATGSPFSAHSSAYNSPSSTSPLYTSPLAAAKVFNSPGNPPPRHNQVALPSSNPNLYSTQNLSSSTSTPAGKPAIRTRTPSQLSKSFSVVDVPPLSELPDLKSQEKFLPPTNAMMRSKSGSQHKPRKLEKRRRSGSMRRSIADSGNEGQVTSQHRKSTFESAGSGSEREGRAGSSSDPDGKQKAPQIHLHHASSLQQLQSDSDQSTRTVVPLVKSRTTPNLVPKNAESIRASFSPPSSYNHVLSQATSNGSLNQATSSGSLHQSPSTGTLTRQRSGIRQPGDPHHLRPPKESPPNSYSGSVVTPGVLSQSASSSDHSQATVVPTTNNMSSLLTPQQAAVLLGLQQPLPQPSSSTTQPQASTSIQPSPPSSSSPPTQSSLKLAAVVVAAAAENEILAFHKAAGNVPKPFKPFAFQFPRRSPSVSNASQSRSHAGSNASNTRALIPNVAESPAGTSVGGGANFAALIAAAGLSTSPSPSPIGRSSNDALSGQPGRGSTEMLAAFPVRASTDMLTAFPPRSSTDALNNAGNGESRQSLQSGYSLEAPWDTREGEAAVSSPSAFSFSTDLYGYGGPGPASASNSIDLYRRVDPLTLFPGGATGGPSTTLDLEGRHSLSLLGGEPLSPAELDSRGLRIRRFREGHASVSSFAAFSMQPTSATGEEVPGPGRATRTPSWTLEALRENLFGGHRRGQDSVASSSVGSQSRRSSIMPWTGLGVNVGPPALASPRDANFQFAPYSQQPMSPNPMHPEGAQYVFNGSAAGGSETRVRTVIRTFSPLLPDELVLRPGEELAVLQEFDDGWCVVAREGLGSNGAPTPPGLDDDEPTSMPVITDGASSKGSSGSSRSRRRVLEMGVCPVWVFDESPPPGQRREYERPMRNTSLSVTVSMKMPPPHLSPISARDSPTREGTSTHPFAIPDRTPFGAPVREEVISWSNF